MAGVCYKSMKLWHWAVLAQPAIIALFICFMNWLHRSAELLPDGKLRRFLLFRVERKRNSYAPEADILRECERISGKSADSTH